MPTELDIALTESKTYNGHLSVLELQQEREAVDSIVTDFPCPDVLWQGLFAVIAERLKKFTWEVWLGALCALGAIAQKNLHFYYHRHLFGMVYGLLISPTGTGKGLCTDVCWALLPQDYTVRDAPSSGPGIFPVLAKIEKNEKGKIVSITPRPAILIIEEWSGLLKSSKIEFSNLQETLNVLFHRAKPWSISRSDTDKSGGDRVIKDPTLSICATSTASLLHEHVTTKMIRSGFLNRYFVVPGSPVEWVFYDPHELVINTDEVRGLTDHLVGKAWGAGRDVMEAYSPEAKGRLTAWGNQFFNPLMRSTRLEAESVKRLHTYAHIISLLYAWSDQCPAVLPPHVEAAIAAVTISRAFVENMIGQSEVEIPKFKQYEMGLDAKIVEKVKREPGISPKKIANDLRASGTYRDLVEHCRRLAKDGLVRLERKGKQESLYCDYADPGEKA